MGTLEGKVAIVTGASKGIGASIARQLGDEGAAAVVNYASSQDGADRLVAEIVAKGGRAVAVQADLAEAADVDCLFAETARVPPARHPSEQRRGLRVRPLDEVTEAHCHRHFDLNVLGALLASKAAVKQFGAGGGSIINISSLASTAGLANSSVYSATKGAVEALTRTLASELSPRNIRVNAVSPGVVDTEGV